MNCEYGVPLWCAEIISALQMYNEIYLNIAMPYEEQTSNWTEELRDRFFTVHAESDHVGLISHRYTDVSYELADEYMIDNSDLLIIVGKSDGNNYAKKYADSIGVKIENLPI